MSTAAPRDTSPPAAAPPAEPAPRGSPWPQPTARSRQWSARYALAAYVCAVAATYAIAHLLRLLSVSVPRDVGPLIFEVSFLAVLVPAYRAGCLGLRDLGVTRAPGARSTGLAVLALLAIAFCDVFWQDLTHPGPGHPLFVGVPEQSVPTLVVAGLTAALLAPVAEEVFFRGFLYRSLRNRLSIGGAALISSVLFAIIHTQYPLAGRVEIGIFGVAMCLLYEFTGSLLPGIAVHSFIDAGAFDRALTGDQRVVLLTFALVAAVLVVVMPTLRLLRRAAARAAWFSAPAALIVAMLTIGVPLTAMQRARGVPRAAVAKSHRTAGAREYGCPIFPASNPINQDISRAPVDPNSARYIAAIGASGHLHADFGANPAYGIPYAVVSRGAPKVPIRFDEYGEESDPGPYPVPLSASVEGGGEEGDRHVLVLQRGACRLYELYHARRAGAGWQAGSGAVFNLRSNALRPEGWTSADAAGLPIFPLLARYPEVRGGAIDHALRVTVAQTQRGYIHPATHFASDRSDPSLPPMGLRLRLSASFALSAYHGQALVILRALKRYGLIVADNGSSWFITGAPNPGWHEEDLDQLKTVPGSAFEAVQSGPIRHHG